MSSTNRLLEMLEFRRPAGSVYEQAFIDRYIKPYGPKVDFFGNQIIDIGSKPNVIWSSHTDTVHNTSGLQRLIINKNFVRAAPSKDSNCLGADCTTGVWLMLEMLDAGVEGRYIFHRDEEAGGKGSKYIAKSTPDVLKGIDAAIAFDRRGCTDIITHQGSSRTASDEFAKSVADEILGNYKACSYGSFTDTKSYMGLVPECTNLSVGYAGAHTNSENQDLAHARWLRDRMLVFSTSGLIIKRKPEEENFHSYGNNNGYSYHHGHGATSNGYQSWKPAETIFDLVRTYPSSASKILELMGWDFESFDAAITEVQAASQKDSPSNAMSNLTFMKPVKKKKLTIGNKKPN